MLLLFKRKKYKILSSNILPSNSTQFFSFKKEEALELLNMIKKEFGLDYTRQEYITIKKLETFAKNNFINNFEQLTQKYTLDCSIKRELINLLTVNESYFFRELLQVEAFLKIAKIKQNFSILSAPCATGEEVYSIGIKLKEELYDKKYTIIGVDINTKALSRAKDGRYSSRSISKMPQNLLQKYFVKDKNLYIINKFMLNNIIWIEQNVFAENFSTLGEFDYLFSRNMLIYFSNKEKKRVLSRFRDVLKDDGYLFLGHADLSFVPNGFEVYDLGLNIYKKV